jgi:hypothetical protein
MKHPTLNDRLLEALEEIAWQSAKILRRLDSIDDSIVGGCKHVREALDSQSISQQEIASSLRKILERSES